jgi:hypothetical protein
VSKPSQPDLFGEATPAPVDPLIDLAVTLPDHCKCGIPDAIIGPGAGPQLASLRCRACGVHRGWLPLTTYQFLAEIVAKFGRPVEPIAIRRRQRSVGFINIGRRETNDDEKQSWT